MKIIIVGASGTIGKHLTKTFEKEHEVIKVGSKSGDVQADITSPDSLKNLFDQITSFDALISATGSGHFGPLNTMTDEDFRKGIDSKLLGQINLVLIGQHYINPKGSFTLTAGVLSEIPIRLGANLSAVNGAVESFVRAAAIELEHDVRINAVSPDVVEDSPDLFPYFPGHNPVSMKQVVNGYIKSVLGADSGKVIKIY